MASLHVRLLHVRLLHVRLLHVRLLHVRLLHVDPLLDQTGLVRLLHVRLLHVDLLLDQTGLVRLLHVRLLHVPSLLNRLDWYAHAKHGPWMSEMTFLSSMGTLPTFWAAWVDALLIDAWVEPDGCGLAVSGPIVWGRLACGGSAC